MLAIIYAKIGKIKQEKDNIYMYHVIVENIVFLQFFINPKNYMFCHNSEFISIFKYMTNYVILGVIMIFSDKQDFLNPKLTKDKFSIEISIKHCVFVCSECAQKSCLLCI